jgi:hypothetical protein
MRRALAALAVAASLAGAAVAAQPGTGPWRPTRGAEIKPNVPYNGQFTFVRLRYGPPIAFQSQRYPWSHDYPFGEQHFMQIINEVTNLKPRMMETQVMALDDPELPKYPVAYMSEPGYWVMSESEASAFRAYLQKGGFVIFDDFAENRGGWDYFEHAFQQVIPGARWMELDGSHPIFHAFFEIPDPLGFLPPYDQDLKPAYLGLFEDNDPARRLMAIVNYNNDISEYWEFSNQGFAPITDTNEAYKLGVNYVIYGLTH